MAVTDILQISANGLPTVRTCDLIIYIKEYCAREPVDLIVVGLPLDMKGNESESMRYIRPFLANLKKEMPDMKVELHEARFTSVIAHGEMIAGGFTKK